MTGVTVHPIFDHPRHECVKLQYILYLITMLGTVRGINDVFSTPLCQLDEINGRESKRVCRALVRDLDPATT